MTCQTLQRPRILDMRGIFSIANMLMLCAECQWGEVQHDMKTTRKIYLASCMRKASIAKQYNDRGLRIEKIKDPGGTTKYVYNGTKIATEFAPDYRLDFLYDENDNLKRD